MGLLKLTGQFNVGMIADLQENNGQITGNGIPPQTRLSPMIFDNDLRICPKRFIGKDYRTGQTSVKLGISLSGIDLPQSKLAVRPGQIENTVGQTAIAVFLNQGQGPGAGIRHAGNHIQRG